MSTNIPALTPRRIVRACTALVLVTAASWCAAAPVVLQNRAIRVEIALDTGRMRVVEKASGRTWDQPAGEPAAAPVYRLLSQRPEELEIERACWDGISKQIPVRLRLSLPSPSAPEVRIVTYADVGAPIGELRPMEPFVLDAPQGVIAVSEYSNGHLYPLDMQPFPVWSVGNPRLDMPWVGVCDLASGRGYMLLMETSDDARIDVRQVAGTAGRKLVAPAVAWRPELGVFGYARSQLLHFAPSGGYVALCKRYREYARTKGLIVTLGEKAKRNPRLRRLFGAPDVWGNASLPFAREAKAAGVDKMLIHGRPTSPADMRAVNALGYLTSEYDNYTDIMQTTDGKVSSDRGALPADAVLQRDGKRMTAWLTWDKQQYMKRCPSLWAAAAAQVAARVLPEWPFLARFIDVTTAEGYYECTDPEHPLTHRAKRAAGVDLFRVFRNRGLVMGGEHGWWWAVPWLDYIEGMQSGGSYSWPAGYLMHPKTKAESFDYPGGGKTEPWSAYEKWGIGHETRVPLWELVFHDCIVSTWYWGDATDWLLDAAPEVTARKDAFNVLYGTVPLLWANAEGSWVKDRAVFLRTYRNTCKLHEAIAGAELVSHEFVTTDRAVQRTRFSDGTTCVVNFGDKPAQVKVAGRAYLLPPNGWAAKGPRVAQSMATEDGEVVTRIRAPGYAFTDSRGASVSLRTHGIGRIRATVDRRASEVVMSPRDVDASWTPRGSLVYRADATGRPEDIVPTRTSRSRIRLVATAGAWMRISSFVLLWGAAARRPDLRVSGLAAYQGRVTALIENAGCAASGRASVRFLVDGAETARQTIALPAGGSTLVSAAVDPDWADGRRAVRVVVDAERKATEISEGNNARELRITNPFRASKWPHHRTLSVALSTKPGVGVPVSVPFVLPRGADPGSVRVALWDSPGPTDWPMPAQLDGGDLCFTVPGSTPAGMLRRLAVLWRDAPRAGKRGALRPAGTFWRPESQSIVTPAYELRFEAGTPVFLAPRSGGVTGPSFLKSLIVSSAETGWADEGADVREFRVLSDGPVRTVIRVRKALKTGAVCTKRYTFYERHFELEIDLDRPAGGLYARAHYLLPGTYTDGQGHRVEVDGRGEAEGVLGQAPRPTWYAVAGQGWAHTCVALTPFDNVTYWDAGSESMGAIGFTTPLTRGLRMAYTVHAGAANAGFGEMDWRRLTTLARVEWE